jgi:hypothetical protein
MQNTKQQQAIQQLVFKAVKQAYKVACAISARKRTRSMYMCVCREDVGVSFNYASVAFTQQVIMRALVALQAANVDYETLFTTDGREDSCVSFTVNNVACEISTCYDSNNL